jgi:hypothetical protein
MLCIVLAEALLRKLGGDTLSEIKQRFDQLPLGRLDDFAMANEPIIFWD